jgi:hypothetical protein
MRKILLAAGAAALFVGTSGTSLMAQAPETAAVPDETAAVRDPQTIAALEKMGAALRNLKSFEVRTDTTEERVLTTGQKVQFGGYAEIKAQMPNKLRVDRVNDRQERSLYLDGSMLTIYSPRIGFYGQVPATGTLREVTAAVAENYDIETPLADLFALGEDPAATAKIKSAFYVGAETVGGIACDQYAMRQDDVDWQVWIRQKGEALPCKIVITSTDDPSMPQHSAVYTWFPQKAHAASVFTFAPPKGSHKIPLEKKASVQPAAETAAAE